MYIYYYYLKDKAVLFKPNQSILSTEILHVICIKGMIEHCVKIFKVTNI